VIVTVVGGGLAGCEAAWALAERGHQVVLVEMRPVTRTAAHQSDRLAELVCSNSFKSIELENAHGLLKAELRDLGSLLLPCADLARGARWVGARGGSRAVLARGARAHHGTCAHHGGA
jgi:methylenetetrahydrofolate--tRNA-(uracil-5-)-methyltransferase